MSLFRICFCPRNTLHLFSHFYFPVNGGWSQWSPWSPCSSDPPGSSSGSPPSGSCSQVRTRRCDDPAPANGGAECPGSSVAGGGDRQRMTCPAEKCDVEEQKGRMISNIDKRSFFSDLCQFSFWNIIFGLSALFWVIGGDRPKICVSKSCHAPFSLHKGIVRKSESFFIYPRVCSSKEKFKQNRRVKNLDEGEKCIFDKRRERLLGTKNFNWPSKKTRREILKMQTSICLKCPFLSLYFSFFLREMCERVSPPPSRLAIAAPKYVRQFSPFHKSPYQLSKPTFGANANPKKRETEKKN